MPLERWTLKPPAADCLGSKGLSLLSSLPSVSKEHRVQYSKQAFKYRWFKSTLKEKSVTKCPFFQEHWGKLLMGRRVRHSGDPGGGPGHCAKQNHKSLWATVVRTQTMNQIQKGPLAYIQGKLTGKMKLASDSRGRAIPDTWGKPVRSAKSKGRRRHKQVRFPTDPKLQVGIVTDAGAGDGEAATRADHDDLR